MFENIMKFFKKKNQKEEKTSSNSKEAAKERLHLVLMQDRANVSADFLELMKQEIIEVIKKYIDVDESAIDVRLTNKENEDGTHGAPALYANIPILNIKNEARKMEVGSNDKVKEVKEEKQKAETTVAEQVEKVRTEVVNSNEKDKTKEQSNNVAEKSMEVKKEETFENKEKKEEENKRQAKISKKSSKTKETINSKIN